jgi:hypothetical protein
MGADKRNLGNLITGSTSRFVLFFKSFNLKGSPL